VNAISLFSGAGGLDLGCEAAGFRSVATVECNETAFSTLTMNRKRWLPSLGANSMHRDIVNLDPRELLQSAGASVGEIDLIHGGPPCTPFSKSGYWLAYKRAGEDPKASLLDDFIEKIEVIQPKAFLMENVFALGYRNHNRPVLERFVRRVKAAGYSFDREALIAADYGVPQLRQRLICVGVRGDLLDCRAAAWRFSWPSATHAGPHETRSDWDRALTPHCTAGEALADLPDELNPPEAEEVVSGKYMKELKGVPPGQNYLFWTAKRGHPSPRFKWRSRYWTFLLKLDPNRPSPTIQAQPGPWVGPFHWESRRLRVAEVKRLMGFPDEYVVSGTRREQQMQLGNAVPPRLGEVVAQGIRQELERLGAASPLALAA
jgi:DNA (cytosine-5)-methyltransferase 1